MSFNSWLQNLRSALAPRRGQRKHARRGSLRAATHRLSLEPLEDRRLLAFSPATSYPLVANPGAVVTADFNNDGRLDLATVYHGGIVSVLLAHGPGGFDAAHHVGTGFGSYPTSLAVGDFNNDGKPDIVTVNIGSSDLSVLLGNGDGTFQPQSRIGLSRPLSVAVGDFNKDGKLDLGVGSGTGGYIGYYGVEGCANVLLGNGDGSFASPSTTEFNGFPVGAALADINGDGNQDFLTANGYFGTVSVLLGNGDGTLQAASNFVTGGSPQAIAAGDVNGDGKVDLVAATSNPSIYNVSVLLGEGQGDFGSYQNYAAGSHVASVALADFNHDSVLDIVVPNFGDNAVSVLLARGNGTFSTPLSFATGAAARWVAVGDFNGDGRSDVAVAAYWSNAVSVLLNDGAWPGPNSTPLRIGDVTLTEGNTGTVAALFTVTLSAPSDQPVTIAYATGNGTATAGSDYQAASGTLTFAPGETSKTITVQVNGDRLGEASETFFVNLSSPINAIITDGQGVGTIADDEPRISIGDFRKVEGKKGQTTLFTFTVTLSAAYDQPATMLFRTVNGTAKTSDGDYLAKTGTLTFLPGETTKTITIEVKGDSKREANETFYLDLYGLGSNALFTKNRGIGTILNDD